MHAESDKTASRGTFFHCSSSSWRLKTFSRSLIDASSQLTDVTVVSAAGVDLQNTTVDVVWLDDSSVAVETNVTAGSNVYWHVPGLLSGK